MKKLFKTAIIVMALGLMATACQKVKATSLIGTYKLDGKSAILTVNSEGEVSFDSRNETDLSYLDYVRGALVPFDLTSQKQSYSYSFNDEVTIDTNTVDIKFNLNFEKNGREGIKCTVSYNNTITGNKSLTFTK